MGQVVGVNDQGLRVGQYHQHAKLTDVDVLRLLELRRSSGWGYGRLAAEFAISKRHVRNICAGKCRRQPATRFKIIRG
jgi:hypothetical protein